MLKRIAFIVAILGSSLLILLLVWGVVMVEGLEDLEFFEINKNVLIGGVILGEKDYGNFRVLNVQGVDILCDCKGNFLGREVFILGVVGEYLEKKQINVLVMRLK